MKEQYCETCNEFIKDYDVKEVKESFNIRGLTIKVNLKRPICRICHEDIFVKEIEKENDRLIYDTYKKMVGLLTSSEIKAIREKRGLSQRQLARLIFVGDKDITRYENGAIQNKSIDLLIRLVGQDDVYDKHFLKQIKEK